MKCTDLQLNLSLYADGMLDQTASDSIEGHLDICPLCREAYTEIRGLRNSLSQMRRAELSTALSNSIKDAVRGQRIADGRSWLPFSADVRDWIEMRLMPYTVGVTASIVIGFTFLTMMFSGMLRTGNGSLSARSGDTSILLASNSSPFSGRGPSDISPAEFAQTRLAYASESPSVNPQGALIALTKSIMRGEMRDDEVAVVADVFGNGLAQIAEVVEPSRDRRAVLELQKALESDPAYAAFVPTTLENRPDSVRVVLKMYSVNVKTGN